MTGKLLKKSDFNQLIASLKGEGYEVYGPQVKDSAIVFELLDDASQLPANYTDDQQAGSYRLYKNQTSRWFAWANASQGIKPLVFVPTETLWSVSMSDDKGMEINAANVFEKPKAIIGVRNCDLVALDLQDQHFLKQDYIDPHYEIRRKNLFLIAVNCTHPAQTCFCESTGDGPIAQAGFDIVLDELDESFLIKPGSDTGNRLISALPLIESNEAYEAEVAQQHVDAKSFQKTTLPDIDIKNLLVKSFDSSKWDDLAKRCLSCGNCTSVCPTCFCYSEKDQPELDGQSSERVREWDSCFNQSHSYIHGFVIRSETKFRYRQWLTHKFSGWFDQYGRSGCVGCGRCVTWCPVGIDVVEAISNVCESSDE